MGGERERVGTLPLILYSLVPFPIKNTNNNKKKRKKKKKHPHATEPLCTRLNSQLNPCHPANLSRDECFDARVCSSLPHHSIVRDEDHVSRYHVFGANVARIPTESLRDRPCCPRQEYRGTRRIRGDTGLSSCFLCSGSLRFRTRTTKTRAAFNTAIMEPM